MGRVFNTSQALSEIARSAQPLSFINAAEYDPLLAAIDPGEAFLRGFTTCSGEVTAASKWDEPAQRKIVRRALPNNIESLFHETRLGDFLLRLRKEPVRAILANCLLHCAALLAQLVGKPVAHTEPLSRLQHRVDSSPVFLSLEDPSRSPEDTKIVLRRNGLMTRCRLLRRDPKISVGVEFSKDATCRLARKSSDEHLRPLLSALMPNLRLAARSGHDSEVV